MGAPDSPKRRPEAESRATEPSPSESGGPYPPRRASFEISASSDGKKSLPSILFITHRKA